MAKKTATTDTPALNARRSEYSTTYKDDEARTVHATRHNECEGKVCADCGHLGFTKTFG